MSKGALLDTLADGVRPEAGGSPELVPLDPEHPGFRDSVYRARRNAIAKLAYDYVTGDPAPTVSYTDEEHAVWGQVCELLEPRHRDFACSEYRECVDAVALDRTRIPQLEEVNARIRPLTGFRMLPVAGLVTARAFLSFLADRIFLATQYIRHPSRPLYTPEPDVIHELVGHAASFAHPLYCGLSAHFGRAARVASDADVERIARLYWFTLEFGAAIEDGVPKAYGAGLLSSVGEMDRLRDAELRRFDCRTMADTNYDPTDFQPFYFVAPSFGAMCDEVSGFLRTFSD